MRWARRRDAHVIRLAGPPGIGKSMLNDALSRRARKHRETVGVITMAGRSAREHAWVGEAIKYWFDSVLPRASRWFPRASQRTFPTQTVH